MFKKSALEDTPSKSSCPNLSNVQEVVNASPVVIESSEDAGFMWLAAPGLSYPEIVEKVESGQYHLMKNGRFVSDDETSRKMKRKLSLLPGNAYVGRVLKKRLADSSDEKNVLVETIGVTIVNIYIYVCVRVCVYTNSVETETSAVPHRLSHTGHL